MTSLRIFLLTIACITVTTITATSRYSHPGNAFGSLLTNAAQASQVAVKADDKKLEIANSSNTHYVLTDTACVPHNYTYSAIIANKNNKSNKKVSFKDSPITSNENYNNWGIAFDIKPNGDMLTVEFLPSNKNIHNDIENNDNTTLVLKQYINNTPTVLTSVVLDKNFAKYDNNNIIVVEVNEDNITVSVGKRETKQVINYKIKRECQQSHVGILAGAGAKVEVKRTMINYQPSPKLIYKTEWDLESLRSYFKQTANPIEGFWTYLDRDMDDKWLKLGGKYSVAVVMKNDSEYEILYCDGAQVMKNQWEPCMLKGTFTPTMFTGVYNGTWIDATFEPIVEDVQVTIENGVIMTIKFPVYKSQVRFSKVIEQ